MCLIHADGPLSISAMVARGSTNEAVARAAEQVAEAEASGQGIDVPGGGSPDVVVAADRQVVDGFSRVLHNRWNRGLRPVTTVRPGEVVQLLCRDAGDIGEEVKRLASDDVLTLDLARAHPLTGPIEVLGAEPGDVLEVEVLDVRPLVDFGYSVVHPLAGLFGALGPELAASTNQFSQASELSYPASGPIAGAIPEDQPFNAGAAFVQLVSFDRGQDRGFGTLVGADSGRRARIPITPFMGIHGVAPRRAGMYRTIPPSVSGAMGGNLDVRQLVKGTRLQLPVFVEGALFSVGDGHMAQGDGEVCTAAVETLMAVTLSFQVIKNLIIDSPRAIVPAADPVQLALGAEAAAYGYYQTLGTGPDLMANAKQAVLELIDWLVADQGVSIHEAYVICSVSGDLKISEVVNQPNWVVSMTLPRAIFADV